MELSIRILFIKIKLLFLKEVEWHGMRGESRHILVNTQWFKRSGLNLRRCNIL